MQTTGCNKGVAQGSARALLSPRFGFVASGPGLCRTAFRASKGLDPSAYHIVGQSVLRVYSESIRRPVISQIAMRFIWCFKARSDNRWTCAACSGNSHTGVPKKRLRRGQSPMHPTQATRQRPEQRSAHSAKQWPEQRSSPHSVNHHLTETLSVAGRKQKRSVRGLTTMSNSAQMTATVRTSHHARSTTRSS